MPLFIVLKTRLVVTFLLGSLLGSYGQWSLTLLTAFAASPCFLKVGPVSGSAAAFSMKGESMQCNF